jgi:ATPase subunit of ABC transporter with duplicated ATPase domains
MHSPSCLNFSNFYAQSDKVQSDKFQSNKSLTKVEQKSNKIQTKVKQKSNKSRTKVEQKSNKSLTKVEQKSNKVKQKSNKSQNCGSILIQLTDFEDVDKAKWVEGVPMLEPRINHLCARIKRNEEVKWSLGANVMVSP